MGRRSPVTEKIGVGRGKMRSKDASGGGTSLGDSVGGIGNKIGDS
ncbi:hypothetical protein TIFTF001_020456 [Ficus carica]|uniref:Uncharacterized protein n=1 Tax=Ficus carica TaxID=3494 RepID=A0AA88AAS2_FICCA|nr:hypothetical protein TIFTF001_020456 [Ficus carica]